MNILRFNSNISMNDDLGPESENAQSLMFLLGSKDKSSILSYIPEEVIFEILNKKHALSEKTGISAIKIEFDEYDDFALALQNRIFRFLHDIISEIFK